MFGLLFVTIHLNLTAAEFQKESTDVPWFFLCYAPWCGHCKRAMPFWDEFGESLKDDANIVIGKLDCVANQEQCEKLGVHGYPTFKVKLGDNVLTVSPRRDLEGFKAFLDKITKSMEFNFTEIGDSFPYFLIENPEATFSRVWREVYLQIDSPVPIKLGYKYSENPNIRVYFTATTFQDFPRPSSTLAISKVIGEYSKPDWIPWSPWVSNMFDRKQVFVLSDNKTELDISGLPEKSRTEFYFCNGTYMKPDYLEEKFELRESDYPAVVVVSKAKIFVAKKNVRTVAEIESFLKDVHGEKVKFQTIPEDQNRGRHPGPKYVPTRNDGKQNAGSGSSPIPKFVRDYIIKVVLVVSSATSLVGLVLVFFVNFVLSRKPRAIKLE